MPRKKKEVLDEIEIRINALDAAGVPLLSDEERAATLEKAKEHVRKAKKDKAIDALLAEAIKVEEREYEPFEQIEDFCVDLPEYAPFIKINNVMYFHGLVYEVPYSKARDMAHIQYRAWCHEREWKEGRSPLDMNRSPRLLNLSPGNPNGRVNTTTSMRDR
jgi:hypothetical protein